MSSKRLLAARISVMAILALLALQFELGMAVNVAKQPALPPFGFSLNGVSDALNQVGVVAVIHASLGAWLVLFSLISIIFALRSGVRSVQVFGSLAFVATCLALTTGLLYTLSGFQNDGYSEGMATNFLLSFAFNFLELYFLKPAPKT
ncbi:MAG: hypothetical protein ABSG01_01090 [Anaerolineales bacterium]|jgi:hypothetical protein